MKKFLKLAAASAVAMAFSAAPAQAATVFVGSWYVGDGPVWTSNPTVLSAREAAALLFGGTAADYAISTIDDQVANINFRAHVDGWGDSQYLTGTVDQDYKLDLGAPGYNDPAGGATAYSAYVLDHSCDNRYSDPSAACTSNAIGRNFAFRIDAAGAVPEPATWAMLVAGFGVIGFAMRRRENQTTRVSFV